MLNIRIGNSGQSLTIADPVLKYFSRYRQRRPWMKEAGGQLFAEIAGTDIIITSITGPRRSDTRSRYGYRPDRRREQVEIDQHFAQGLHYVGDWHTHPERYGNPSSQDVLSMKECVRKSRHRLRSFVLVIVGTADLPDGLHISLHSGSDIAVLWGKKSAQHDA